jgi:hypothetical protein
MWIIAALSLAAVAFVAVSLGFVPPPNASTLLHFREGAVRVTRGSIAPHAREHVSEILSGAGVLRGFIGITPSQHVAFSRHIPAEVRQRLRNVLLNQWA